MKKKELVQKVNQFIADGYPQAALTILLNNQDKFDIEIQKDLKLLSGRYQSLCRDNDLELLEREFYETKLNRINSAILNLCSRLKYMEVSNQTSSTTKLIFNLSKIAWEKLNTSKFAKSLLLVFFILVSCISTLLVLPNRFFSSNQKLILQEISFSDSSEIVLSLRNIGSKNLIINKVKAKKLADTGTIKLAQIEYSNLPNTLYVDNLQSGENDSVVIHDFVLQGYENKVLKISAKTNKVCDFEISIYHSNSEKPIIANLITN